MTNNGINYQRELDIFNPEDYADSTIHIIGDGGIGSFVCVALSKLGLKTIVWDGDKVELHNVPNQFHLVKAVGISKVKATAALVRQLANIKIDTREKMWEGEKLSGIVISAVDSMAERKKIWDRVKADPDVLLLIDGRIGGETIEVVSICPVNDAFLYGWYEERKLFDESEAAKLPCTARSIIDVGFMISAIITRLVRGFLKNGEVMHDIIVSMADLSLQKVIL